MVRRLFCFLSVVFVCSMFSSPADCDDRAVQDQPRLYTNQDIKKYQTPSETGTVSEQPVFPENKQVSRKDKKKRSKDKKQQSEEHEMEYWCKKATTCNRKIEDEKAAIKEIEDEIFEAKTNSSYSHKENAKEGEKAGEREKASKEVGG